jgi:hypothetical protein
MKNTKYIEIPLCKLDMLKQFIRGSILGDGSIPKQSEKSKNYRITFGHGHKQKAYLEWKHDFLEKYLLSGAIVKRIAKSDRYKTGECISYHFKSKTHPIFTEFRNLYYNDKRFINKEDISKLDEFGLAIWYMDDGNITRRKKRTPHIELNTQSFLSDEIDFLVNLLQTKWNIRCARMTYSNIIRISSYDCQKFLDIIEPYKVKCLAYKWVLDKEEELLES